MRSRTKKSEFKQYLLKHYDRFASKAYDTEIAYRQEDFSSLYQQRKSRGEFCHGDYQYHNILFSSGNTYTLNFEKMTYDIQLRDVALFMRKALEKSNWSQSLGERLLLSYGKEQMISDLEMRELYYRLLYPEKFWKIVNFYYNSGKAFIPDKNIGKIEKLLFQEDARMNYLDSL